MGKAYECPVENLLNFFHEQLHSFCWHKAGACNFFVPHFAFSSYVSDMRFMWALGQLYFDDTNTNKRWVVPKLFERQGTNTNNSAHLCSFVFRTFFVPMVDCVAILFPSRLLLHEYYIVEWTNIHTSIALFSGSCSFSSDVV